MLEDGRWDALRAALGTRREALVRLAGLIHSCPELGGQEVKAAGWLVEFLAGEGFSVHRTVAGMDTAFRADWSRDGPKPAVIFLAEYDALPELGHACGHNLIAAAAAGAGAVLRQVMNEAGLTGTITVLGTPAEETAGGKIDLLKAGVFADGDAALMMHPATASSVGGKSLALIPVRFTFRGRAAHAAASPQDGINALEAVIQTFNGVNALRQHLPEDVRVHGIVTRGGLAPNVVPDLAEAYFYVRAATMARARVVLRRLTGCARAGALSTGASLRVEEEAPFCEVLPNPPLERCLEALLARAGLECGTTGGMRASTDFGNVTHALPAASFTLAIAPPRVALHSPEFAEAAASPRGERAALDGALILAAAGLCLLETTDLLPAARAAWRQRMGSPPGE